MTKAQLLRMVSAEDHLAASRIFDELEIAGLDQSGTATSLRYGITYPADDGTFYPIAYFGKGDAYLLPPRKVVAAIDEQTLRELKTTACELGFYRPNQIEQPDAASLNVKYAKLAENIPKLASFLATFGDELASALQRE